DMVAGDMVASDEPEVEETETLLEQLGTLEDKLVEAEANLADAEKKAAEYLDGWQRAQAAFANFRKRTEAEQTQWRSRANEGLLSRLIPILDDFQRAFEAVPEDYEDDTWLDGIRLVERKLKAILDSENVTAIELESGDMFDPQVHEAVLYQEVDGFEEGQVVAEVERGYMIGDRVLRPALVVVAKGAAKASKPEEEEEAEEGEVVEAAAQEQAGSQSESKEHE
ncbi:MAG: nucleotide exchange factor GrpE, partial [Anaerolineae bacterium]